MSNPRNLDRTLFLGRPEQLVLAGLLESRACPPGVDQEDFRQLQHAELSALSFEILRELCDAFGASLILDSIRWPRVRGEQ